MSPAKNPSNFGSQNGKAKSSIVSQIARIVRKAGLDYAGWRYVAKKVRKVCDLPGQEGAKVASCLDGRGVRRFYAIVDRAEDVQHSLMLRLLFFTAVRVSELCRIEVGDVDLEACKIFVSQGKGSKDRYVLFGRGFATALRTHLAAHKHNRYLFQTRRATRYSTRRVEQIVQKYAEEAGVPCTPHTFRHQAITWLTRHSGMADAELQLNHRPRPPRNLGGLPARGPGWGVGSQVPNGDAASWTLSKVACGANQDRRSERRRVLQKI